MFPINEKSVQLHDESIIILKPYNPDLTNGWFGFTVDKSGFRILGLFSTRTQDPANQISNFIKRKDNYEKS
jgi:hypothetical protein